MTDHSNNEYQEVQNLINEIVERCSDGQYIFRGESRAYTRETEELEEKPVACGLYRQYFLKSKDNPTPIVSKNYGVIDIEKEISKEIENHFSGRITKDEMLTELQHNGGNTALIDFSKNLHVALFFACEKYHDINKGEDGKFYFFNEEELKKEQSNGKTIKIVYPKNKTPRVIFQSSVFVRSPLGYLNINSDNVLNIPRDLKRTILNYLDKFLGINQKTIYNDLLGFIHYQNKHTTSSIEFYKANAKLEAGDNEGAIKYYSEAIELNPKLVEAHYNRGNAKYSNKDYAGAISDYSKASEINPNFVMAYYNRGNARRRMGDVAGEISDYSKAIELNPKFVKAYFNRGIARNKEGNIADAMSDFNMAIDIDPKFADAYNSRGSIKANQRDFTSAIVDYEIAIKLNPKFVEAYNNRGNAKACNENYKSAIADFDKAIEIAPNLADAYNYRGAVKGNLMISESDEKLKRDRAKGAVADFDKAIEINPKYESPYYNRASIKAREGNYTAAISDYSRVIELDPKNAEAYYNRGLAKAQKGEHQRAISDYDKAIELNPTDSSAYYCRSIAKGELGLTEEAEADFRQSEKLQAKQKKRQNKT